jgi:hypothetical protein
MTDVPNPTFSAIRLTFVLPTPDRQSLPGETARRPTGRVVLLAPIEEPLERVVLREKHGDLFFGCGAIMRRVSTKRAWSGDDTTHAIRLRTELRHEQHSRRTSLVTLIEAVKFVDFLYTILVHSFQDQVDLH